MFVHPVTGAKFFIGDEAAAMNLKVLEKCQIFRVVNAKGDSGTNYHEKDKRFEYFRFGVHLGWCSNSHEEVLKFFAPVHQFIDENLEAGRNVMVHCLAGAHRAGTTGVSYLMKAGNLGYIQARQVAKSRRPVVDPLAKLEELLYKLEAAYEFQ